MNLLQGVYATIMGLLFALILEWRGNLFASVFLHMGANIWSLPVSYTHLDVYKRQSGWKMEKQWWVRMKNYL